MIPAEDNKYERLGITNRDKLSAASKRALEWKEIGNEWYGEFEIFDLKGDLAYEESIVRRDPSGIIIYGNRYYVWYSRSAHRYMNDDYQYIQRFYGRHVSSHVAKGEEGV